MQTIHELWGQGSDVQALHRSVRHLSWHRFPQYVASSFRFRIDSFRGSRPSHCRVSVINGFEFLGFKGDVKMKGADEIFTIFEEWEPDAVPSPDGQPSHMYFGRLVGTSSREQVGRFDLKKRAYISTTSMDAELTLVTANMTLAAPGKLFYDPFVGTGSFPLAAAHFGALSFGSDIDGRTLRGTMSWTGGTVREQDRNIRANFEQYGLGGRLADLWVADLINTPIQHGRRWLDGIMCDPPYGVREGLRVLGHRNPESVRIVDHDGIEKYK